MNFVCNNCPNRSVKSITQVTLETAQEPSQGKDHTVEGAMDEAEEDLED
ncbi:MAG: hypothetical protein KF733_00365 [Fimbriimonadaceae bacterium]|nr:MAG: hypothetical protein KF733_00365 [Fimbriimonadaceae bacterium]